MYQRSSSTLASLCAVALLASSNARADVVLVDPSGAAGPPTVQAAVDAALDGDTIVILPGDAPSKPYQSVTLDQGRSLTITAPRPQEVLVLSVRVTALPLSGRVVLQGLDLKSLHVEDTLGAVVVDDCRIRGESGATGVFGAPGVQLILARDVVITDSLIVGSSPTNGALEPDTGLDVVDSRLALFGVTVEGGAGRTTGVLQGPGVGNPGAIGLIVRGSSYVWLGGSTVEGGTGGYMDCHYACTAIGGTGGLGAMVEASARVVLNGSTIEGGPGGSSIAGPSFQGVPGADVVGPLESVSGPQRTVSVNQTVQSGQEVIVEASGLPGETIQLYAARRGGLPVSLGTGSGQGYVDLLPGMPITLGTVPASGTISASIELPAVGTNDQETFFLQTLVRDPSSRARFSTLETVTVRGKGLPSIRPGARVYVNGATPAGGNGRTWGTAFNNLGTALRWRSARPQPDVPMSEIWVAAGTYCPAPPGGNKEAVFPMRPGTSLLGGFNGTETSADARDPRALVTILDADILGDDTPGAQRSDNTYSLLRASAVANEPDLTPWTQRYLIDGFTLRGSAGGAALHATSTSHAMLDLTVLRCVIADNHSIPGSGAPYSLAGGLSLASSFYEPSTQLTLLNSQLIGNTGPKSGAVYFNQSDGASVIAGNIFAGNVLSTSSSYHFGGAISVEKHSGAPLSVANNTFWANGVEFHGTFHGTHGAAIYIPGSVHLSFHNNVVWNSHANGVYGVRGFEVPSSSNNHEGTFNLMDSVPATWANGPNLTLDPALMDAIGPDGIPGTMDDDLRLSAGSPAIDAGDNFVVPAGLTEDVAGQRRLVDDLGTVDTGSGAAPVVDMGAHERQ